MGVAELNEPEDDVEAKVKSKSLLPLWRTGLTGRVIAPQEWVRISLLFRRRI
jgi:hypothetical protein